MDPEKIVDAEFEVVSPPHDGFYVSPQRKPRLGWWVIAGRVLCVVILAYAAWDILSDGVPSRAGRAWLETKDTVWLDNAGYIFNFARNGELPPASASPPSR